MPLRVSLVMITLKDERYVVLKAYKFHDLGRFLCYDLHILCLHCLDIQILLTLRSCSWLTALLVPPASSTCLALHTMTYSIAGSSS